MIVPMVTPFVPFRIDTNMAAPYLAACFIVVR